MIPRARELWFRFSENIIVRTLWYLLLIVLSVLLYQSEVPFVYAQF
jgi:hypothetical protein